ncbi:tetratricopeptide repeat protein [Vibrio caribbeanicus]|uniref:beta-barrel assembly-enhancing protease n=1 Tax=Vibrio caribbeanicus TaxID=701175 RepID=UPI002283D3AB|nr:M48 family metallopeptidase [Vibrio caribbeanicus]MCY9846232.1 M48 family metallopeptidase [Vibrio caribbeanicus]
MLKRTFTLIGLYLSTTIALIPCSMAKEFDLPEIGTAASTTLTIDQEIEYGDAYMRMLRGSSPIINDPVLNEYLNNLGHRLVANASDVKTPFQFFLIQDRNINAFAFFGGHVALYSGLFLHAQSESELASVLAHEIAHVTQRHLARSMEEQAKRSPLTMAALAGSVLLAIAAPQAGIAAVTATAAGSIQGKINYTRSNEKEADRIGISTLSKAGFDVSAMPRFFGRLAEQYRYASTPPPMLLTHPLPEDRIADTRARAESYPKKTASPSFSYQLARARIVARYAGLENKAALSWLTRKEKKADLASKAAFEYGKTLVYMDNKELDKARPILEKLISSDPQNLFYIDAISDLYIESREASKATVLLEKALIISPSNPVLMINHANSLMKQHRYEEAVKILQRYTHDNPEDLNGWRLLSESNIHIGNEDEDLAARAELLALQADWNKAIQYYTKASQITELGSLKQARYDARIDELMVQRERFAAFQ